MSSIGFLFHEAWLNIRRNGWMSVAALSTITVSLAVLGGVLWAGLRVHEIVAQQPQQFNMIDVFMKPTASRQISLSTKTKIESIKSVKSVFLITKEQAWADLTHRDPTLTKALPDNPLMDRLQVVARNGADVKNLAHLLKNSQLFPNVMQVNDSGKEVRILLSFATLVRNIGIFLALSLAVATLFIVTNTIRLTAYARRREISIMSLVGATSWFIRLPLLVEGLFHGVVGGFIGSLFVLAAASEVAHFVAQLNSPLLMYGTSSIISWYVIPGLVGIGAIMGISGSLLAIRRYVHA